MSPGSTAILYASYFGAASKYLAQCYRPKDKQNLCTQEIRLLVILVVGGLRCGEEGVGTLPEEGIGSLIATSKKSPRALPSLTKLIITLAFPNLRPESVKLHLESSLPRKLYCHACCLCVLPPWSVEMLLELQNPNTTSSKNLLTFWS